MRVSSNESRIEEEMERLRWDHHQMRDRLEEARADAAYWRVQYEAALRVLHSDHPDKAYLWLDEIVCMRFGRIFQ